VDRQTTGDAGIHPIMAQPPRDATDDRRDTASIDHFPVAFEEVNLATQAQGLGRRQRRGSGGWIRTSTWHDPARWRAAPAPPPLRAEHAGTRPWTHARYSDMGRALGELRGGTSGTARCDAEYLFGRVVTPRRASRESRKLGSRKLRSLASTALAYHDGRQRTHDGVHHFRSK
jgi:hypothetical protein